MANTHQVALVTGASSGMGKVIAQQLIKDGLTVVAAARRVEQMDDLKALGAHPVAMDVSDEASRKSAVAEITNKFLRSDTALDYMGFLMNKYAGDQNKMKREMIGSIVMTRYNSKTYRVDDVDFNMSPRSK